MGAWSSDTNFYRKLHESVRVLTVLVTDLLVDEFEVAPAPKPKETEAQPEPEVSGEENREEGKTTCLALCCLFSLNLSLPQCQESYDFKKKKFCNLLKHEYMYGSKIWYTYI